MLKNKNNQNGIRHVLDYSHKSSVTSLKVWRSITLDQGAEFAHFKPLEEANGLYNLLFVHRGSPWQRGSNENMNRRLRRYLPRCFPVAGLEQDELTILASNFNRTPRRALG